MKRSSLAVNPIATMVLLAILMTQTVVALPIPTVMHGQDSQVLQTALPPPPPRDLLNARRVFVQNNGVSPVMYSHFLSDIRLWGHYSFADSPKQADVVFEVHDEPLSVVVVGASTNVILATVSVPNVPPQTDQSQEETTAAQNLVSAMKQFVGVSLSPAEKLALTPPKQNKHAGLIFGCVVAGSLAIAAGVVLLLRGRGHSGMAVP